MRQLVELKKNADKFSAKKVEVIATFREEKEGEKGLQKIKEKTKVDFTLALDTGAKQTAKYSPGRMEFTGYVVDRTGIIRGKIEGDLRKRANSAQLLKIVDSISMPSSTETAASSKDDKAAVRRAVLDYVEGVYDLKPEYIERSVHPELKKFGFWRPEKETEFKPGSAMTFEQLKTLAANYNKDGRIPKDAPKEIEIYDVMDKMAAAKLTAAWGMDYFHLIKENGQWKILQIVWQSPPKK